MKKILLLFLLFLLSGCGSESGTENLFKLELHKAFPVAGSDNIQPSGLTLWQGGLFTISDRDDSTIFRLQMGGDTARMIPYRRFRIPGRQTVRADFEGITSDNKGNFFLISETKIKILKVPASGKPAEWITLPLRYHGEAEGLFRVKNAYVEGILWRGENHFLICAEREPRGFLDVKLLPHSIQVKASKTDRSRYLFRNKRSTDFTGLAAFENKIYVLERNAFVVSEIQETDSGWVELGGWCYEHIETSAEYAYDDMRYGKAEGLAIDSNFVYIILDNNLDRRVKNLKDNRPLLFVFRKPDR